MKEIFEGWSWECNDEFDSRTSKSNAKIIDSHQLKSTDHNSAELDPDLSKL